jgi:hypothetical protein
MQVGLPILVSRKCVLTLGDGRWVWAEIEGESE